MVIQIEKLDYKQICRILKESILESDEIVIPFIGTQSRKCLNNYQIELCTANQIDNKESLVNQETVLQLWKSLLVDAISFLKHNDNREALYHAYPNYTYDEKTRYLNAYAIEDLIKYLDDFSKFESILYGSDEWYRDHLNHVILVWIIGILLIKDNISEIKIDDNFKFFKDRYESIYDIYDLVDYSKRKFNQFRNEDKLTDYENKGILYITDGEIWAIWTIIALCHDLGYPVSKTSKINEGYKKILSHFGKLNIEEFNFSFTGFNDILVEKFLKIVASRPRKVSENPEDVKNRILKKLAYQIFLETNCLNEKNNWSKAEEKFNKTKHDKFKDFGFTTIQSKFFDKFAKSMEDYKHGMFSALLLFKTLTFFQETDFSTHPQDLLTFHDLRQFFIRREILRSICTHTCEKVYHLQFNTLPFLLILCDELQAWGRPRFEEILGGKIQNVSVKINKIDFIKTINPDRDNEDFGIDAVLDYSEKSMPDKDADKFVRGRFKMFHQLLRSASRDWKRNFKFKWEMKFKLIEKSNPSTERECSYIFNLDNNNNLEITKGEEEFELYEIFKENG